MPDLINLTLSVTVDGDDASISAANILSTSLVRVLDNVPNVQGASITVYRDDFLGAEAETKSKPAGDVHNAVADADAAADALRGIRGRTPSSWNEMTFEEQERVRKGELP